MFRTARYSTLTLTDSCLCLSAFSRSKQLFCNQCIFPIYLKLSIICNLSHPTMSPANVISHSVSTLLPGSAFQNNFCLFSQFDHTNGRN